jgi:ubiquitin C-terminal hydrolase
MHNDENSKNNSCDLGDMLKSYSMEYNSNLERECQTCKQRTRTVEQNCILCYPEILCIVLCRSTTNGGKILSLVNFPLENFQPSDYLGVNDKNDDTTYNLIASVNHQIQPNGGGHYYAICRQNISGRWYKYDNKSVTVADFTKCNKVRTVKIGYQRAATILFYIRRSKPPSLIEMSILSNNDED